MMKNIATIFNNKICASIQNKNTKKTIYVDFLRQLYSGIWMCMWTIQTRLVCILKAFVVLLKGNASVYFFFKTKLIRFVVHKLA